MSCTPLERIILEGFHAQGSNQEKKEAAQGVRAERRSTMRSKNRAALRAPPFGADPVLSPTLWLAPSTWRNFKFCQPHVINVITSNLHITLLQDIFKFQFFKDKFYIRNSNEPAGVSWIKSGFSNPPGNRGYPRVPSVRLYAGWCTGSNSFCGVAVRKSLAQGQFLE